MFLSRDDVTEQNASPSWPEVVLATVATALTSFDAILCGMVAAGLGIDALSLYLGLTRTGLLDRLAALGLPTPHDRPMRRAGGKNPWSAEDVRLLIAAWTDGAHVLSIAETLGRSRGAIYSKRRRLGLPSRDSNRRRRLSNDETRAAALAWHGEIAGDPDLFSANPRPAPALETRRARTSTYRSPSAAALRAKTPPIFGKAATQSASSPPPLWMPARFWRRFARVLKARRRGRILANCPFGTRPPFQKPSRKKAAGFRSANCRRSKKPKSKIEGWRGRGQRRLRETWG